MTEHQGYYSIIQYRPDPDRAEGLNVGVVVTQPSEEETRVRLLDDLNVVLDRLEDRRQHAVLAPRLRRLGVRLLALRDRSGEGLRQFAAREPTMLTLLPFRSVVVSDLDQTADELFARLVRRSTARQTYAVDLTLSTAPHNEPNLFRPTRGNEFQRIQQLEQNQAVPMNTPRLLGVR